MHDRIETTDRLPELVKAERTKSILLSFFYALCTPSAITMFAMNLSYDSNADGSGHPVLGIRKHKPDGLVQALSTESVTEQQKTIKVRRTLEIRVNRKMR